MVAPRIFGCACSVRDHDLSSSLDKLLPCAIKCVFLGYLGYKRDTVVILLSIILIA